MLTIVFDASFLIAIMKRPTTWFEDIMEEVGKFRPVMLDCVREELKELASGKSKTSRFAALASDLAASFGEEKCGKGSPDSEMISYAKSEGAMVATLDGEVLRTAKRLRIGAVTLRSGRVAIA